jgi:uncharacterized membrane protein
MKSQIALVTTLLLLLSGMAAQAKPEYLDVLVQTYPPYAASLQARSCTNCHVSDSDFARNPYGKQIGVELEQAGTKTLTPDSLHKIENMDLFGDGSTVLAKLKAGTAPGVAASGGTSKPPVGHTQTPRQEPKKPWFPKYAYHPAIVHFPIALFIAGVILDFLGLIRKNQTLLLAGWYNLVLAALTAIAGLITGYMALVLLHVPFTGIIRQHIITAIISSIIIWILVGLRVHRHEKMSLPLRVIYYVLAAAGMLLISYAGHLGGMFVYGE